MRPFQKLTINDNCSYDGSLRSWRLDLERNKVIRQYFEIKRGKKTLFGYYHRVVVVGDSATPSLK